MGGQKGIALFYQYLSRLLPVTIISTTNNEMPAGMDAQFLPVLGNSKFRYINPFLFFTMKRLLRENNCTHLILEHPYYGWLGILLKRFCNIKLIIHSHNIESLRFKSTGRWWWPVLWRYEKFTHRKADINFFITVADRDFAIKNFSLEPQKCHTITYGFEIDKPPLKSERQSAKKRLQSLHPINEDEKILLFNGTLDYKPNQDAVDTILHQINPALLSRNDFKYKIIICGKGLPAGYNDLKAYQTQHIIYAGFVDDINVYFKGADIFINPVTDGGGIKTKLVEALGFDLAVVSTASGAIGVPLSITGNKLLVIADGNWQDFSKAILSVDPLAKIPAVFFDHFFWGNIAAKVKALL
ncbi:hypothetical protein BH11BAC4_BH11BAC4_14210 [soil metagenome]